MASSDFWATYFELRTTALRPGVRDLPTAATTRDQATEWLEWRVRELSATVAVLVQMLEERGGLDVAACRHRAGMIMEDAIVAAGGYARCIKCDRSVEASATRETSNGSVCVPSCRR